MLSIDIREVKPPVPLSSSWVWVTIAAVVATLVALAVFFWLRAKRRTQPQPEIKIPPYITALDKLRAALALIHQPEPFCVEVSQIVRVYLEQQFKLHAPERTTEEFLTELQDSTLLGLEQKRVLADFLMRCDLVKFARYEPGEPELRELYDAAVKLVEETRWINPVASGEPSPSRDQLSQQPTHEPTDKSVVVS